MMQTGTQNAVHCHQARASFTRTRIHRHEISTQAGILNNDPMRLPLGSSLPWASGQTTVSTIQLTIHNGLKNQSKVPVSIHEPRLASTDAANTSPLNLTIRSEPKPPWLAVPGHPHIAPLNAQFIEALLDIDQLDDRSIADTMQRDHGVSGREVVLHLGVLDGRGQDVICRVRVRRPP